MTFEEKPPAGEDLTGDAEPPQSSAEPGVEATQNEGQSVPDHDSWVSAWAKKSTAKKSAAKTAAPAKQEAADDEPAGDASPTKTDSAQPEPSDESPATKPQGSPTFAAAVGDFLKRTPVRLDAKTKAELAAKAEAEEAADQATATGASIKKKTVVTPIDDSALVFEREAKPTPTTVGGKIARAFTSDRTTAALGVFGELLITGGAVVLMFLAWQLWINNAIVANEQAEAVKAFSNNITASPTSSSLWTPKPGAVDYGPPPVLEAVGQDAVIGNLYVPRLGSGSTRAVANGVNNPGATINRGYYGKYEDSQWPGQPGNFAMAVHRTGWGTSFTQAHTIRPGDHMYLETPQGWYIYTVRNTEYVVPTQVNVVNPMPLSDAAPVDGQSIMTITTCSPMNGNGERLIVYGILSSWQPLEAGIPTEITKLVEEARA